MESGFDDASDREVIDRLLRDPEPPRRSGLGWPSLRLTIGSLIVLTLVAGFDLAVLARAYQHGHRAGAVTVYLVGFGTVLLLANMTALELARVVARLRQSPPGGRVVLLDTGTPGMMLFCYLLLLAILFLRPGTF